MTSLLGCKTWRLQWTAQAGLLQTLQYFADFGSFKSDSFQNFQISSDSSAKPAKLLLSCCQASEVLQGECRGALVCWTSGGGALGSSFCRFGGHRCRGALGEDESFHCAYKGKERELPELKSAFIFLKRSDVYFGIDANVFQST